MSVWVHRATSIVVRLLFHFPVKKALLQTTQPHTRTFLIMPLFPTSQSKKNLLIGFLVFCFACYYEACCSVCVCRQPQTNPVWISTKVNKTAFISGFSLQPLILWTMLVMCSYVAVDYESPTHIRTLWLNNGCLLNVWWLNVSLGLKMWWCLLHRSYR